MGSHKDTISKISEIQRDSTEKSVKQRENSGGRVARGAGFEPARPERTTGLAGLDSSQRVNDLPPTRLGQPRFGSS